MTMQFYGFGSYRIGIYLRGGSHSWIRNMKFNHNLCSVYARMKSDYILVEYNSFVDSKYILNWDGVKVDDGDKGLEVGGVAIGGAGTSYEPSGRGFVLRFNSFENFFDAFNFGSSSDLEEEDFIHLKSNENDIHDNYISKCRDDGFEVDGFAQNVRVYNNYIEWVLAGISMAPSLIGPVFVINNRIIDIHGWTGFKFIYGVHDLPTGTLYLFHNVVWNRKAGSAASIGYFPWQNLVLRNNILIGYYRAISIDFKKTEDAPVDCDYDGMMAQYSTRVLYWNGYGENDGYFYTLSSFIEATKEEKNGMEVPTIHIFESNSTLFLRQEYEDKFKGEHLQGINNKSPSIGRLPLSMDLPTSIRRDVVAIALTITFVVVLSFVLLCVLCCLLILGFSPLFISTKIIRKKIFEKN